MRAALAIAFLAASAKAFDFNAYQTGFNTQLGLSASVAQDEGTCFTSIQDTYIQIVESIMTQDYTTAFTVAMAAKTQLPAICAPLAEDFQAYAAAHATMSPQQAGAQYAPQVIQAFTQWVDYLNQGQAEAAGQQEGYIIQILLGAANVTPIALPQINSTQIVPLNVDAIFNQYLGAFFNGVGVPLSQANVADFESCYTAVVSQANNTTFAQDFATGDFDGKVDALQAVFDNTFATVKDCQGALDFYVDFVTPSFVAFESDPVNFILTSLNNMGLNMPEYVENSIQAEADLMTGQYAAAGALNAESSKIVMAGLNVFPTN